MLHTGLAMPLLYLCSYGSDVWEADVSTELQRQWTDTKQIWVFIFCLSLVNLENLPHSWINEPVTNMDSMLQYKDIYIYRERENVF